MFGKAKDREVYSLYHSMPDGRICYSYRKTPSRYILLSRAGTKNIYFNFHTKRAQSDLTLTRSHVTCYMNYYIVLTDRHTSQITLSSCSSSSLCFREMLTFSQLCFSNSSIVRSISRSDMLVTPVR